MKPPGKPHNGKGTKMIVDFHTHVFPPEVLKKRDDFVSREPAFSLIYGDPKARMVTIEGHLEAMDLDGVNLAVICGFPWADPGLAETANAYLLDAQNKFPETVYAFYTPPLSVAESVVLSARDALQKGMKGIGEVAFYTDQMDGDDWSHLGRLAEVAMDFDVPLLLHVNESVGHIYPGKVDMRIRDVWRFASQFPDLTLVLAHWGGGLFFYELMKSVGRSVGKLYYDTAASPFLYAQSIYRIAVDILGPERILFGSDYPLIKPSRYFREMDASGLTPKEKSMILGENARSLLKN